MTFKKNWIKKNSNTKQSITQQKIFLWIILHPTQVNLQDNIFLMRALMFYLIHPITVKLILLSMFLVI